MNLVIQNRNFATMMTAEDNPLRLFLVDMQETGFGIEDIFHELIEGVRPQWDNNATGAQKAERMFSYDENKIHKTFHVAKDENQVKTTIDTRNYNKIFTPYGVTSFIDAKLANLSYSMEVWLYDKAIETIQKMISDGRCVFVNGLDINTHQGIANACETIKATTSGFLTLNSLYNYGVYDTGTGNFRPVRTKSKKAEDIVIITTPENFERLKVQGYANAFNLSQFELKNRVIYVPSGTDLGTVTVEGVEEEVLFVAMDYKTIVMGINFWKGSSVFIPTAFETNNFLTAEILKSYNTFFNAVAFSGSAIEPIKKKECNGTVELMYSIHGTGRYGTDIKWKYNGEELLSTDFELFASDELNGLYTYRCKKPLYSGTYSLVLTNIAPPVTVYIDGTPIILNDDMAISGTFNFGVPSGSSINTSYIV